MPHPNLYAIRDNLDVQDKQAHRTVAFLALDDILDRARPRYQWSHPHAARVLGVSPKFVSLIGNYLDYRRTQRRVDTRRGIRPWGPSSAQLFLFDDNLTPMDLLNLGTSGDRTEQMAKLLMEATVRRILVEPGTAKSVESMIGRACGMAWDTITSTFQRQSAAQNAPSVIATRTTTAMEGKAA